MVMRIILIILIAVCLSDAWWGRRSSSGSSGSGSRSSSSRSGSRSSSTGFWSRSSTSRSGSRSSSSRSGSSGRNSNNKKLPHDMNKNELKTLFNSKVTKVEKFSRPLNGFLGMIGIKHTGVVATTEDGGRYLIHKGAGYGKASSTVVVDAKHMSDRWKKIGEKPTSGKTISDLMQAGYVNKEYGLGKNRKICYQSTNNIMNEAGRKKRKACK